MNRVWTRTRHNPSAVLMVVQLLGILIYPWLETSRHAPVATAVFSIFGLVVLALAILAVQPTPSLTWVSILLGVPIVVFSFVDAFTGAVQPWHLVSDALHAVFYFWTAIALIRYMFADHEVTSDELWATGAAFTVFVWAFAYVYSILQTAIPGTFIAGVNSDAARTWTELLFLSCTTMTSTGLSDILPVKPVGRSVVMVQQIAGMMYLALVVARLVGLGVALGRRGALSPARQPDQDSE